MTRRFIGAILVGVAGAMSGVLATQAPPQVAQGGAPIRLRATTFTPEPGQAPGGGGTPGTAPGLRQGPGEYLVQFQGPVREEWKTALAGAGAELLDYVPDFAFHVHLPSDSVGRIRQLPFVAWVGPYLAAYKLGPAARGTGDQLFIVRLERGADGRAVAAALSAAGMASTAAGPSTLMVRGAADRLGIAAAAAGVASVEPFALRVRHNEYGGGVILGSRTANTNGFDGSSQVIAVADTGLGDGTPDGAHPGIPASRVLAIANRPGTPDFCFETIVDDGAADVDTGHGTHVATAALGAGSLTGAGRGTAPASGLVFQALENYTIPSLLCSLLYGIPDGYYLVGLPADLGELFTQAYDLGARVHSDSWGAAVNGAYTTDSENTDAFVWAHRDMAVVFSAGNSGVDGDADGIVDPGSVGAPGTAKNVITIGASENDRESHWECDPTLAYTTCAAQGGMNTIFTYGGTWPGSFPVAPLRDDPSAGNAEQMAAFSSRGPTADGRIKPDVVAPGTWTLSGYANPYQQQYDASPNPQNGSYQYDGWGFPADQFYKYMGGTSMAAPLVAGGASVVRDFYQKVHAHAASAALVKATLINSAVDLLDENNDGLFDNAFPIPNVHEGWGRVDLAGATRGGREFSDEAAPLTTGATASFTYGVPAGSHFKASLVWTDYPSSTTTAVSLVNDLDLTVVAPDGTVYLGNAFSGGWSVAGGAADRVNNVENVFVPVAMGGTWTAIVSGYNVPMGPQPFALVVDTALPDAELPVVRASVDDGVAGEAGLDGGVFRVTRTGPTSSPLTVAYTVGGSATPGEDYAPLPGLVTIPAGDAFAQIPLEVFDDPAVEPVEQVTITLTPDAAYDVRSPASASIGISSDDLPPDLVVSAVTAPSWATAGEMIGVTDTTRNQGTMGAGPFETGFYLSADSVLDEEDVFLGSRSVPALEPGASNTATTAVPLPASVAPGIYRIIAQADWSGVVEETSDANNTRTSGNVRIGPDLTVTAMSAPSTAAAGDAVLVTETTKNQGTGISAPSVTGLYLSSNSYWDSGDVRLGQRAIAALDGGEKTTASTALVIPPSTAVGTYYILAVADADGVVTEVAENNNVRASGSLRIGVDLQVTAMTAPSSASPGAVITVTDTTRNSGGADAPETTTDYYLSTNSSIGAGDTWLGARPVPELAAGTTHTGSVSLTIPASTPMGTYYIVAKADGPNDVAETSEANNTRASGTMQIGPDLTVVSVTAPSWASPGGTLSVTANVKNQGGAPTGPADSVYYLSSNSSLGAGDIEVGRRTIPGLAPGAIDSGVLEIPLSPSLPAGTYYVLVQVDPDNLIAESVETNNLRASGAIRIGPDLVISSVSGPRSTVRGSTITVSNTTKNQGGGPSDPSVTGFYLSTNSALDAADIFLGSHAVPALDPGASTTASTPLTIPASLAPGTYYLIVRADDGDAVVETAENNNTRFASLRVDP